jgi:hypothetical protein
MNPITNPNSVYSHIHLHDNILKIIESKILKKVNIYIYFGSSALCLINTDVERKGTKF